MSFGNSITEFSQVAVGTTGYTIKCDTTSLLFDKLNQVQAQASATDTPSPAVAEVTQAQLQQYLNSASAPDLAFNYGNGEATIFFKTSVFPYEETTRFALFGLRNIQKCTSDSDFLDVPDKDFALVQAYALEQAGIISKGAAQKNILDTIEDEERRVRNE